MTTIHWPIYLAASIPVSLFALAGWIFSLARNQTNHIDAMWPLFIGMSAYIYALFTYDLHARTLLVLVLVTCWALRLCAHLSWRAVYLHLDQRHRLLANKLQPGYWLKSLYHLFLLYGFLAWLVSIPLFAAIQHRASLGGVDLLGTVLVLAGLFFETIADWQLLQFRNQQDNETNVYSQGLWGYCRHPNYFGELSVWTGFYLIALSAGAWWSVVSLMVMVYLIFWGSGIPLLESGMTMRKPGYSQYQKTTNLILPYK